VLSERAGEVVWLAHTEVAPVLAAQPAAVVAVVRLVAAVRGVRLGAVA